MRQHLVILLAPTVVLRGRMMTSYPMSGKDDNQAAQPHLIDQLLHGNLLLGNLRYRVGWWFYTMAVLILLSAVVLLSVVNAPGPRIYAAVYTMLWTLLIGGMIAAIWLRLERR